MILLSQATQFDWQALVVFVLAVGALAYLVSTSLRKKGKSCGSGQCGCVKKKEGTLPSSRKPNGRRAADNS